MLHNTSGSDHQGLTRLLKRCPNLTNFSLSFELHYTIPMGLRRDLHGCLGEDTIPCTSLRSLHLSRFSASEEVISHIILANPSIERLTLLNTSITLSAVPPGSFPALRVLLAPTYGIIEEFLRIGAPKLQEIRQMGPMGPDLLKLLEKLVLRAPHLAILGWKKIESVSSQDLAMELSCMLTNISIVDEYGAHYKIEGTALERVGMKLHYVEKQVSHARSQKDKMESDLRSHRASGKPVSPNTEILIARANTKLQSLELTASTLRNEEEMLRATSKGID
jgi:hypothetical protein